MICYSFKVRQNNVHTIFSLYLIHRQPRTFLILFLVFTYSYNYNSRKKLVQRAPYRTAAIFPPTGDGQNRKIKVILVDECDVSYGVAWQNNASFGVESIYKRIGKIIQIDI